MLSLLRYTLLLFVQLGHCAYPPWSGKPIGDGLFALVQGIRDGEADLEGHLVLRHLAVLDMPPDFKNFEPAEMLQVFRRPFNGFLNGILNAMRRGTDKLNDFVNVLAHMSLPTC